MNAHRTLHWDLTPHTKTDRHALPLTPVVELRRLSANRISYPALCAQSVSETGLGQRLGLNPSGQIDSIKRDFIPKLGLENRTKWKSGWNRENCWSCVCEHAAVGVSTLWVNLFFQTPSRSHYQSEGRRRTQCVIMTAEKVLRDRLSPGSVCFQIHSPTVSSLIRRVKDPVRPPSVSQEDRKSEIQEETETGCGFYNRD